MRVCSPESKTEFLGLPSQMPEPSGVRVWDAVLPYLDAARQPGSLGRLGHYELLELIGEGGFGVVLKALDEKLQRVVAIKILSPLIMPAASPRMHFLREARAAAKVQHENVVRIYAVEERPLPYIVMEYVAGPTLQNRIDASGALAADQVVRLGRQMALGLAAAHAQGLIHRDIKPANILLEGDGARVKITDFGIARTADDAQVTQNGLIVGTPMYMSPEQAGGEALDHRSDLFSLGSVLYTMACGRPPFRSGSGLSVLKRVNQEQPKPIPEINPGVPAGLCRVISRLQARAPRDRFDSAAQVAEELGRCLDSSASRSIPWRSMTVLAACVLIMSFMAGFVVRERQLKGGADAPPAPVALPAQDQKLSDRDVWRQQLAAVPGPEKEALFRQRLKALNPQIDLARVVVHLDNGEIIHVAIHKHACPDITPLAGLVHLRSLHMDDGAGVTSFEPMRGLRIHYINCPSSDVTDLSPLEGAPLETLRIWGWKGGDLRPLRGMPLQVLNIGHSSAVSDLTPLRELRQLKSLAVNRTRVSDLAPLAGMRLDELLVEETLVADLSVVRGMPLTNIGIRGSKVANTAAIRGLPLKVLAFDYEHGRDRELLESFESLELINQVPAAQFRANLPATKASERDAWREQLAAVPGKEKVRLLFERLKKMDPNFNGARSEVRFDKEDVVYLDLQVSCSDLTVFAGFPKLNELFLHGTASGVKSLEPLRGLPLATLSVLYSDVTDLSPLQGMPLRYLCLWAWKGADLSPLRGMSLQHLNCGNSSVSDLSPLKGMSLNFLCVNATRVTDLSPLAGMKLNELMVENTLVEDISVVRDMPLKLLTIRMSRVGDTSPIRGLPLNHLLIDYTPERDRELIASLKTLEQVNQLPLRQFLESVK